MIRSFVDALGQLQASGSDLDTVIDRVSFAVFVDHVELGCIYTNAEALRMFGLTWDEFRGFGWAKSVLPEDMETLREAIERYEIEKSWIEVRYRIRLPDDSIRALHVLGRAVVGGDGEQRGSVMIARDVTVERAMGETVVQNQKLEAVGRLAGRVAHDFNNVLTPIMFCASLLDEEDLSDEGRAHVETIEQAVGHAASITQQLLGLSNHRVHDRRVSHLDHEVMKAKALLDQLVGETLTLAMKPDAAGVTVGLPPHELGQIILNLVVNARDAMAGRSGTLTVSTAMDDGFATLQVADQGVGISVEVQQRMFDPFFTTKSAESGTGLGLAIVKDLAEQAGGSVDVKSELGRGTVVSIRLPVLATKEAGRVPLATVSTGIPSQRVLVVDDNAALRQTLAFVLALRRHTVEISGTQERAQELMEAGPFDVLVTDVLLGDGSGSDLVRWAKGRQPELRVIYMSGFTGDGDPLASLGEPGTVFLPKPFHPNRLAAALAEVVQANGRERSTA